MKKERPTLEEFAAKLADEEDNPTIHELAKAFPEKTYRELEKYRDSDRQEEANKVPLTEAQRNLVEHIEAGQIPLTESQQKQEDLEPIGIGHNHPPKGVCVTGALRKDREGINLKEINLEAKIKGLETALANALVVNESHQKLNGKLQKRVTELEEKNKKMHDIMDRRVNSMRKAGM